MNAAVECQREVDVVVWTERDRGIKPIVVHDPGAANLPLNDFVCAVVFSALSNLPRAHDPAKHGLRPPRHDFVRIRTHRPAIRQATGQTSQMKLAL